MTVLPSRWLCAGAAAAVCMPAQATVYLSVEQAQQAIFPGGKLVSADVRLSDAQRRAIEEKSGVNVRASEQRVWRVATGGYFILDEVLGKHEFITYAVGLNGDGSVKQIEILEYRETYGYEIRDPRWRAQFVGRTAADPLKLERDVRNISGATLSCRHVTDGVKRLLALYELVLK
jgi:Na+-translocating ferredoxin:NAD+ oxidoreductase RnfG subunit